jgi:hypothetical protein
VSRRSRRADSLLPVPTESDAAFARYLHVDLRERPERELWAEQQLLQARLADLFFRRVRPRLLWQEPDGRRVSDQGWMLDRLREIEDERRARHGRGREEVTR